MGTAVGFHQYDNQAEDRSAAAYEARIRTLKAQAAILIHELGHLMTESGGAAKFQHDAGSKQAGRDNDKLVDDNCGRLIGSLK